MYRFLVLSVLLVSASCSFAQTSLIKANEKAGNPVLFSDYFLFYDNLTNISDLGFEWIFDTKDPASLEIKITYINMRSSVRDKLPYSVTEDLYDVTTITSIDGIPTAKMTRQQAVDLLKGTAGTNCTIGIKFHTAAKDELHTIVVKREAAAGILTEQGVYKKAIESFKKGQFESAIQSFKLIQYYPGAQIMLWKIYSGRILDEISFADNDIVLKSKLKNYSNQDSLIKYSSPTSYNPQLLALKGLYCYSNTANATAITSAKNILTKLAAVKGDVFSQEYMVRLHTSHYDTDASFISKNILPDKEQAWYWYKRAVAGGSKNGAKMLSDINKMKTEKDVYGAMLSDYVFDSKDVNAIIKEAHLKNAVTKILPNSICPFGVKGFENGIRLNQSRGIGFQWTTHIMQDYEFANKHYEYALQKFRDNLPRYEFKDIQWMDVQVTDRYVKAKVAHFTATETDGRSYIVSMSVALEKKAGGYQILLEYKDIDKITKAVKVPQAEIEEDDEDG
jgi:tetratricopeptide (TPR) repeat protein